MFSVVVAAVLGGLAVYYWVNIDIKLFSSSFYSCVLRIPKQKSRSTSSSSLSRCTLRSFRSLCEKMGFPVRVGGEGGGWMKLHDLGNRFVCSGSGVYIADESIYSSCLFRSLYVSHRLVSLGG